MAEDWCGEERKEESSHWSRREERKRGQRRWAVGGGEHVMKPKDPALPE